MSRFKTLSLLALFLYLPLRPASGQTSALWQQRVHYEMDVQLFPDTHRMKGFQRLTYYNNAPDTLRRVFFHLYFNAFNPASMMAERNRVLPDPDGRVVPRIFNLGPDEIGYHDVQTLTQNGRDVVYDIDDTVMEVELAEPIPPGGEAVFEMWFVSQVPLQTRRSGRDNLEGIDYSMSQWYPKLAAYDERGWHADPYVGREFYAPFGTFDVDITLPANYVIGATGVLQNADAIGHGYQADTTRAYSYDPADSLTWRFHAENVHDFAWAADPDYVHERTTDERGITYHWLFQPDVAATWARMREWMPAIIGFYSDTFGPYPYPQFTVVQAGDGGMEYPMINFITGRRSPASLLGVTAHEAGHEWFYGVLGSNEADYAWMDEGFTSWATTEAVAHVMGRRDPSHRGAFLNVLALHHYDLLERFNTPSDWFTTNAAYGVASYAGGEMLAEMLGYVISDSLRDAFWNAYYQRFQFRHPNPYDVERVAEEVSGLRLDWYFEQFLNTTRTLDYALADLDAEPTGGGYRTTIILRRTDDVVMPVDLRLTLADGTEQWVNVPLTIMEGHKPVPETWIVADAWPWTSPTYTLTLMLPARVAHAEIDPRGLTPEVSRLNNTAGLPLQARFLQPPDADWFHYSVGYRPLAQYANDFGLGLGLQARGAYLFGRRRLEAMIKLWPRVLFSSGDEPNIAPFTEGTSAFDGIDYTLAYEDDVPVFGPHATAAFRAEKHLGVMENTLSLTRPFGRFVPLAGPDHRVTLSLIHQYGVSDRAYVVAPSAPFWRNHIVSARLDYRLAEGDNYVAAVLELGSALRRSTDALRASANRFYVDAGRGADLGPLRATAQVRFGVGATNLAYHKRFRLGAASFEERWRSDAYRSIAATVDDPVEELHFVAFEGPGPVAYLRRPLQGARSTFVDGAPVGRNVLAGSLTLGTGPLTRQPWLRPLRLQAFSGAGTVWSSGAFVSGFDVDNLVADAGLGLSYDVGDLRPLRRWTAQSDVLAGLQLTARFPFWASDPLLYDSSDDPFAFRWLIGLTL